jgi:hypothetical protein
LSLPRILHAALASIPFLIFQSASAAVNTPAAQVSEERQRDRSTAPAAAGARRNTHPSPRPDQSGKTGKAQQVKGQTARANSDRVRSLLNRQAMRHGTGIAASRRAAAAPTAAGNVAGAASGNPGRSAANPSQAGAIPSPARAIPAPGAASSAPNMTARRTTVAPAQNPAAQNSAARAGTLGGPRAQAYARLGGPASAKPAHAAALNGSQVLRPRY